MVRPGRLLVSPSPEIRPRRHHRRSAETWEGGGRWAKVRLGKGTLEEENGKQKQSKEHLGEKEHRPGRVGHGEGEHGGDEVRNMLWTDHKARGRATCNPECKTTDTQTQGP